MNDVVFTYDYFYKELNKDNGKLNFLYETIISSRFNIDNNLKINNKEEDNENYYLFDKKFSYQIINISLSNLTNIFELLINKYLFINDYLHSNNLIEFLKLTLFENNINIENIKFIYPLSLKIYPKRNPVIYLSSPSLLIDLYKKCKDNEINYPKYNIDLIKEELIDYFIELMNIDSYLKELINNSLSFLKENNFKKDNEKENNNNRDIKLNNKLRNKKIMIISGNPIDNRILVRLFNKYNIDSRNVETPLLGEYQKLTNQGDRILDSLKRNSLSYLGIIVGVMPHQLSGNREKTNFLSTIESYNVKVYRNKDLKLNESDLNELLYKLVKDNNNTLYENG